MNSKLPRALLVHDSAFPPDSALGAAHWQVTTLALPKGAKLPELRSGDFELFALLADARTGISDSMILAWQFFQDRQLPRLLIVQGISESAIDFDDIVLIGNRTLEELATPYLVLHDDLGKPTGLIELASGYVLDYSHAEMQRRPADDELLDLVKDFKVEYELNFADLGLESFATGIYAVAIPIDSRNNLGVFEINEILKSIPRR